MNLSELDPFTVIYRNPYKASGGGRVIHLDPNCPLLNERKNKGRLGAALAAGRRLCSYEAGEKVNLGGGARATPRPKWKILMEARNRKLEATT